MEPTNTIPGAPKKSNGALIGIIIVILILVIGGIYLISQNKEVEPTLQENYEMMQPNEELSESDELESIEADLNSEAEVEILLDEQPDQAL